MLEFAGFAFALAVIVGAFWLMVRLWRDRIRWLEISIIVAVIVLVVFTAAYFRTESPAHSRVGSPSVSYPHPSNLPVWVPTASTNGNTASVPVFFGTDRQPLRREAVFADLPTNEPGELWLGYCVVSVPRIAHRIGLVERPTLWSIHVSDWFENPTRHFIITKRFLLQGDDYWSVFRQAITSTRERQVLLFVHGYNVSFDAAIYRAAQLAFDLKFDGIPAVYSWPSNAAMIDYVSDKDRSVSTLASFKQFLVDLSKRSGARTIHVIAHSMGNNSLVHALAELHMQNAKNAPRFQQIVMAAPDVDRREYLRIGQYFERSAKRITLYSAANDRALLGSQMLHRAARVGDSRPMFVRQGLDSIDASSIIKGYLNHSYFADARVLSDIGSLFMKNAPPPRFGLIGIPTDAKPTHWAFR